MRKPPEAMANSRRPAVFGSTQTVESQKHTFPKKPRQQAAQHWLARDSAEPNSQQEPI
jgi:hypothetical protein